MAKFKCKQTGLVYEFQDHDVEGMRQHPDYEEVKEQEVVEEKPKRKAKGE
jgi:hypothetical protein